MQKRTTKHALNTDRIPKPCILIDCSRDMRSSVKQYSLSLSAKLTAGIRADKKNKTFYLRPFLSFLWATL